MRNRHGRPTIGEAGCTFRIEPNESRWLLVQGLTLSSVPIFAHDVWQNHDGSSWRYKLVACIARLWRDKGIALQEYVLLIEALNWVGAQSDEASEFR